MWVPVAVRQPCELLYTCYLLTYYIPPTHINRCLSSVHCAFEHGTYSARAPASYTFQVDLRVELPHSADNAVVLINEVARRRARLVLKRASLGPMQVSGDETHSRQPHQNCRNTGYWDGMSTSTQSSLCRKFRVFFERTTSKTKAVETRFNVMQECTLWVKKTRHLTLAHNVTKY